MKVYVGADHNGFFLKQKMMEYLRKGGYEVIDDGNEKLDPADDYPVFAERAVKDLHGADDPDAKAILICGSGQGMCIAANRFKGIRATVGYDHESVRASRNDDNANVLCLPARTLAQDAVFDLVDTFLKTPFAAADRFNRRLREIDDLG
jgi:ribose 5-phosphate isomerase B